MTIEYILAYIYFFLTLEGMQELLVLKVLLLQKESRYFHGNASYIGRIVWFETPSRTEMLINQLQKLNQELQLSGNDPEHEQVVIC